MREPSIGETMSLIQKEQATLQVQPQAVPDEAHITCTCPKCGAALDYVKVYCNEENVYDVSLSEESYGKEFLDWSTSDVVEGTCKSNDIECPKCGEVLFSIKDEASNSEALKSFLKTGTLDIRDPAVTAVHFDPKPKL